MGKVIPLDANRLKGGTAQPEARARASISKLGHATLSVLGRTMMRSAVTIGRVFLLACFAILITLLAAIGRPLRLLAQVGAVAVLISAGLEYFDHWRHLQLFFAAAGALVTLTVLVMCYERLLEGITVIQS